MKLPSKLFALGTTLAFSASVASGQTIINASFEEPGHTRNDFLVLWPGATDITGWTVGGAGVDWFTGSYVFFAGLDPSASDGNYKVDLVRGQGQGGSVSQVVTGLTLGTAYFLGFDAKVDQIQPGTTITASADSTTINIDHIIANAWIQHELAFVATGISAVVTFSGPVTGGADVGVFVDNVRISTNSVFANPAPARLGIATYAGITVEGIPGRVYRIERRENFGNADEWRLVATLILPRSPYLFFDTASSNVGQRFYRIVQIQ